MLVAGDISFDGERILLRRAFNNGAWMWSRDTSLSVEEVLTGSASCDLVLEDEEQGESIAVNPEVTGFYTTSEGDNKPIYFYQFLD